MMFERCVARSTELMARYAGGLLPACVSFQRARKAEASGSDCLSNDPCKLPLQMDNPSKDNKGRTMDEWYLHRSRDLGSRP
jgi:hypothetical protein